MPGLLMREAARRVQGAGVKGDTLAAHMDPAKARLLKATGGAGTRNRKTGLLQYWAGEGDSDNNGDGVGGGPGDSGMGGDAGGGPGTDGSSEAVNDAVAGAEGTNAANSTGRSSNADMGNSTVDAVASFVARALTKADLYGVAQRAFTEINQSVRDRGISVVDGTGYSGPEGSPAPSTGFGGGDQGNDVGGSTDDPLAPTAPRGLLAREAAKVQSAGRDGDTLVAHINPREAQMLLQAGGRGTVNPTTGLLEFAASRNIILPSGVTIGFDTQEEADRYAAENPNSGAQDQAAAVSQAAATQQLGQPPVTIDDIKSERGAAWNAPGGSGYATAAQQGHNDPTSAADNPQPFSKEALTAAGVTPADYTAARAANSGGDPYWGNRPEFNQQLQSYLESKGYGPDFAGYGGDIGNNFGNWLSRQSGPVQADVNAWLDANDPNRAGTTTTGGIDGDGVSGGPKSTEQRVADILAAESPLMKRAASQGQMLANRRGLLNSTVAAEAAQAAMIDAAVPIASNDAGLENQRWLQQQDIANQRTMQAADIASRNWQSQLDADTRTRIAGMQVSTADRDKIGTLVANVQAQHTSRINNIVGNPEIPAETRAQYIADADAWMRNQLDMLEGMYGVQLDWAA